MIQLLPHLHIDILLELVHQFLLGSLRRESVSENDFRQFLNKPIWDVEIVVNIGLVALLQTV